jgi:hypothetical protein
MASNDVRVSPKAERRSPDPIVARMASIASLGASFGSVGRRSRHRLDPRTTARSRGTVAEVNEKQESQEVRSHAVAHYLWLLSLCVGLAIGASIGAAIGRIGAGIAIGVAVGVAVGLFFVRRTKSDSRIS